MPKVNKSKCISCGMCIEECPVNAIDIAKDQEGKGYKRMEIDQDKCTGCLSCKDICPNKAIEEE